MACIPARPLAQLPLNRPIRGAVGVFIAGVLRDERGFIVEKREGFVFDVLGVPVLPLPMGNTLPGEFGRCYTYSRFNAHTGGLYVADE